MLCARYWRSRKIRRQSLRTELFSDWTLLYNIIKNRNQAVIKILKNVNPVIECPALAGVIAGKKGQLHRGDARSVTPVPECGVKHLGLFGAPRCPSHNIIC